MHNWTAHSDFSFWKYVNQENKQTTAINAPVLNQEQRETWKNKE